MVSNLFRKIPKVDYLLEDEKIKIKLENYPREVVVNSIRDEIEKIRVKIFGNKISEVELDIQLNNIIESIIVNLEEKYKYNLKKVINATGVVIHTNLGRSVLNKEIAENLTSVSTGYSNLEYNLNTGKRGSRYSHVIDIIKEITGAEDALIVNNNAAAVLLVLNSLGKDKEMIVSRGELIEIGGSFRIPDVMEQSGNVLVEVGTTNKTHLRDYEKAITEDTAAFLKVHTSNYKILGFSESVDIKDLVDLSNKHEIPVIEDLGSGVLVDLSKYGLSYEPTVQDSVNKGVDVVTFSGDKLLGGPQAGIIVGKSRYIEEMKLNPLNRALRIDKFTISALETTLRYYIDEHTAIRKIPTLRMITMSEEEIEKKADDLLNLIENFGLNKSFDISKIEMKSQVGGGSMPLEEMNSKGIQIKCSNVGANRIEEVLRSYKVPVIARIINDNVCLDLRTVNEDEYNDVLNALEYVQLNIKGCANE